MSDKLKPICVNPIEPEDLERNLKELVEHRNQFIPDYSPPDEPRNNENSYDVEKNDLDDKLNALDLELKEKHLQLKIKYTCMFLVSSFTAVGVLVVFLLLFT